MICVSSAFSPTMVDSYSSLIVSIRKVSLEGVKSLLRVSSDVVYSIPQSAVASLLSRLLGVEVVAERKEIKLAPGDILIVFHPEEYVASPDDSVPYQFFLIRVYSGI